MASAAITGATAAAAASQARSTALYKQLGFADLVLASVLFVISPEFFGTAVKAGSNHFVLWLIGVVLFFVPQTFIVSYLNRRLPLEGGLYEWARVAYGDRIGFLTAWNLWMFGIVYVALGGMITTNYLAYSIGPRAAWIKSNTTVLVSFSVCMVVLVTLIALAGLRIGKWLTNAGGLLTLLVIAVLAIVPLLRVSSASQYPYPGLHMTLPPATLFTLSVLSKMTFGALCGLEYVAIFAGEARDPARNLPRAILFTMPLIVLVYVLGTSAILAFVPAGAADSVAPIPQALRLGVTGFTVATVLVPVCIFCLLINYVSTFSLNFAANTRLPMVAGWDYLLPDWFTRLHVKYRTPVNSILILGATTVIVALIALLGAAEEEAFELLLTWAFTFYGLAYVALFCIPWFARRETRLQSGILLKLAALPGLLLTLLFVALSIFPVTNITDRFAYAAKTIAVLAGANLLGLSLYRLGNRSRKITAAS